MPDALPGLGQALPSDPDGFSASAGQLPLGQWDRFGADIQSGQGLGEDLLHYGAEVGSALIPGYAPPGADEVLSSDEANTRYGVEGPDGLRFNAPVSAYDAGFRSHMAHERQWRDTIFSRTTPSPLMDFGGALLGSVTDPGSIALALATGGIGEAAAGALGLGEAGAGAGVSRLSQLAMLGAAGLRLGAEGAVVNAPFVGVSGGLQALAGDDYDAGDALRDITAGAILHTGAHLAFREAPALFRRGGMAADAEAPAMADAPPPPCRACDGSRPAPGRRRSGAGSPASARRSRAAAPDRRTGRGRRARGGRGARAWPRGWRGSPPAAGA